MKYFKELGKEDQERAIDKLLRSKALKFNCLTRAYLMDNHSDSPCSVIKYYWDKSKLCCDVILDSDLSTIVSGVEVNNIYENTEPYKAELRSQEDIASATKGLRVLLESGKHYVFDNKCNAFPV